MSVWTEAIFRERRDKAREVFEVLNTADYSSLTTKDRALMQAFGWFSLETDDMPEIDFEDERAK